jgi:NADH dehydrogenase FAD-containing subunit
MDYLVSRQAPADIFRKPGRDKPIRVSTTTPYTSKKETELLTAGILRVHEEEKRRLLTFFVVGAGFTGVEMAGELAEYVPILCDSFEVERKFVSISNVDFLPRVVPNLPEKFSDKIQRRLEKMGVTVRLNTKVWKL